MIRDAHGHAIAPKMEVIISQDQIDFKRHVYSLWYEALILLKEKLRDIQLHNWVVTGPDAQPKPWEIQG